MIHDMMELGHSDFVFNLCQIIKKIYENDDQGTWRVQNLFKTNNKSEI